METAIKYLILLVAILIAQLVYFLIERAKMRRYIRSISGIRKQQPDYIKIITWLTIGLVSLTLLTLAIVKVYQLIF